MPAGTQPGVELDAVLGHQPQLLVGETEALGLELVQCPGRTGKGRDIYDLALEDHQSGEADADEARHAVGTVTDQPGEEA